MQRAVGLGRHLAEDQQDQRQRHGAERHQEFPPEAQRDEAHQHRRGHVDDGAQQEDQPDQPVRVREQRLGEPRAAVAFLGAVLESVAVEAHERGFASGEEGGQQQQQRQPGEEDTN
jgi:hypothetical protein